MKKTDMRTLCQNADPKHYVEREPAYEFSNGKKFTKPQKPNIVKK